MELHEVKDTNENVKETLLHDSISRNIYIYRFIDLLNNITGNVSIALNGKWGSGKTFFVKHSKLILEAENSFFDNREFYDEIKNNHSWKEYKDNGDIEIMPFLPVYYDAWLNDNATDPILSIVYEIIKQLDIKEDAKVNADFKNIIKTFAVQFVENKTGINIESYLDSFNIQDFFKGEHEQQEIHEYVDDFFKNIIKERGNRLVIFIDELDRCRPDYAVKLLERVKHYFSNEDVTYVFSVNLDQLQHTIKSFYGDRFNATEYLDRFFDLTIDIPLVDVDAFFNSICFKEKDLTAEVCKRVVSKLNLSMRQAERYAKIINIAIYNNKFYRSSPAFSEGRAKLFMLADIAPLAIGLRMSNIDRYREFISGNDVTFLLEVLDLENRNLVSEYMLRTNEVFADLCSNNSSVAVDYKERLTEIYNTIFNFEKTMAFQKEIGLMTFDKNSKSWLLNAINLYSLQIEY